MPEITMALSKDNVKKWSVPSEMMDYTINGLVEASEYLGIKVGDNEDYKAFVHAVLEPIYEANKAAKTKEIMFNTEYVPSL